MKKNLNDAIRDARDLFNAGNKEAAISLANELVEHYPHEASAWFLRGSLYSLKKDYSIAISDVSKAITLRPISIYFFNRGCYNFSSGDYESAAEDFSQGLKVYNYDDESYHQYLFFWRAETFIKLNKKRESLSDISQIREDMRIFTFALRDKSDLIADYQKIPIRLE